MQDPTQTSTNLPDEVDPTSPPETPPFSIREFLRGRQALLVHFSTLMSNHPDLVFPHDLRNAMTLSSDPLSFSTIQAGDVGPHQVPGMDPADANAAGSIGIIVDIPSDDCVVTVGANDDGTSCNPVTGEIISGGFPPTAESCARSIDERTTNNEWYVRGFRPLAIFVYGPIWVRHPGGGEVRSKSAFKAAKSAEVPTDITVRSGLCPRNTGGIATCSAAPASRMIVSNIAFHGYWLYLTEGGDDRHHRQSSFLGEG